MPDAPGVAHGVAGRGGLGVEAVVDDGAAVVLRLEDLTVGKARAKAVGIVEAVEVDLRLGMVMGRIGAPLAGQVQHLAQDHVGEGGVVQVEEGLDLPGHAAHQLAAEALVLHLDLVGAVHDGLVVLVVDGLLDIQLAVAVGRQNDPGPPGRQQAVSVVVEAVGPVSLHGLSAPLVGDLAGKEQHGGLLLRLLDGIGVAIFHQQKADVHLGPHIVHGGIDIGVIAVLQRPVLVHIGHWSHLL